MCRQQVLPTTPGQVFHLSLNVEGIEPSVTPEIELRVSSAEDMPLVKLVARGCVTCPMLATPSSSSRHGTSEGQLVSSSSEQLF